MTDQEKRRFDNLFKKGTQALQARDLKRAIMLLERACDLDGENFDAALNLSGAYILAKKFGLAATLLESWQTAVADNAQLWVNLGAAYLGNPILAKEEDQQKAISAFERALELDPEAHSVAYNMGLIYRDRQQYDEALRWFERAAQNNQQDADARYYIEQMKEKLAEAEREEAN